MSGKVATETGGKGAVRARRYGSFYVAEHRLRAMRAYLGTMILGSVGNPLVYLFALGLGLASLVDRSLDSGTNGPVSYLVFVAPALLAGAAVTVAAEETTYPILLGFKWNPIFSGMAASPIAPRQVANGVYLAIAVRIIPTCVVYFAAMVLFGAVPSAVGFLGVLTAVLTGMTVGALIGSYTSTVEEDKGQMAIIMRFGIAPMFLFSGTFFPLSQLPIYLQWIGWISPLWHGAQLGRVSSYGLIEPMWLTILHLVYLVALLVLGWRRTQVVFERRLNR